MAGAPDGKAGCGGGPSVVSRRETASLNQGWTFLPGDYPDAAQPSYDDSAWNSVGLPHSFSVPYFLSPQLDTGSGWYRRSTFIRIASADKRAFLEFQGIFQHARIYVDGTEVGEHLGGYTGFSYDVTDLVTQGDNVIAVRVDNEWDARIAPRAGDQAFMGGIYRDVYLVLTDGLHVTWSGTFVTTPTLAASGGASSTVNVKTEIRNDRAVGVACHLRTDIVDPRGDILATVSSTADLPAGATVTLDQTTPELDHPALWHPDHPTLYEVVTTLSDGHEDVDRFVTPFGFRWFTWSARAGFSLNGDLTYLHGVNVHQDHAGWGNGVADSALFRDVKMVKEAGFNFIRGADGPRAPAFADACDRLGVLLWSESGFAGGAGSGEGSFEAAGAYPSVEADQAPFDANVLQTLTETIRVHRNHPSIVAWSMASQPFATASGTMEKVRALLTAEVALSHELDPTRPAGIGGAQRPADAGRIDLIGDIAGYEDDGATAALFQDPGVANLVTAYGRAGAGERPGAYDPGWGELGPPLAGGFPTEPSWRSGQARWAMFDHSSPAGRALETTGLVDVFRIPKRAWFWYRNAYAHVPPPVAWPAPGTPAGLLLTTSTATLGAVDGTEDALLTVTVVDAAGVPLSENVPVTLTVTSGPGELPTGSSITFTPPGDDPRSDIAIRDGQAAVELRAYRGGTTVVTASAPGLASASVTITSVGLPEFVPGITPAPPMRVYGRTGDGVSPKNIDLQLALNRPVQASSAASTDVLGFANDGDPATAWLAADDDTNAWWQVSLDGPHAVSILEVKFKSPGNFRYRIAVSSDAALWLTVVDQSQSTSIAQRQRAIGDFGADVRYMRVDFVGLPPGQPASLEDVVVGGI